MKKSILLLLIVAFVASCSSNNETNDPGPPKPNPLFYPLFDPLKAPKEAVKEIMTDIYYWSTETPKLNITDYSDVESLFTAYLVPKDRWSWMIDGKSYMNSEAGISIEYGISLKQPIEYHDDYSIKVSLVKHNSPMSEKGVKRGWTLTHIAGTPVEDLIRSDRFYVEFSDKTSNTFTFLDLNGKEVTFSTTQREINSRSMYMDTVFTSKEFEGLPHKVGYMQYSTFNANMLEDIRNTIAKLKTAGIKDLILDLRYNGGGDSRAANLLANLIAPPSADGKVLIKYVHNAKYSSENRETYIKREAGSLEVPRIYIIASGGSASASEVIINCLRPLMEVIQVGTTTYGKPNGMYVVLYPQSDVGNPKYVFLPICFYGVNSVGFGSFEDGLEPDINRVDDLYHDFGTEEDLIKTCLTHIATGTAPSLPPAVKPKTKSIGEKLKTEVDKPGYGLFTIIKK